MTVKNIYPWGNFEMDDETGLPAIPAEGHFFRVTRIGFGFWEVQLRRKRKFRFSKKEESRTYGEGQPITEGNILNGAAHALTNYLERDSQTGDNSLLGDYPPKKLEER
jgi:hypothetical protein